MSIVRRWATRLATALGVTLLLWLVAVASSVVPNVVALTTNVHGLKLADYSISAVRRFAPLSSRIVQEVQQDRPSSSPSASPSASPTPQPSPTPSPSSPIPPLPTLPPLPTATPTVSPLPTLLSPPPLP